MGGRATAAVLGGGLLALMGLLSWRLLAVSRPAGGPSSAAPAVAVVATPPVPVSAVAPPALPLNGRLEADEPDNGAPRPPVELSPDLLGYERQIALLKAQQTPGHPQARAFFELLRTLPPEGYAEAAHAAVDDLRDADYLPVVGPVLANPQTNGAVLSVLFGDLMERPDPVALPALLSIAREPEHPFASSARDNLALLLGHDWGDDWRAWENAVRRRVLQAQNEAAASAASSRDPVALPR